MLNSAIYLFTFMSWICAIKVGLYIKNNWFQLCICVLLCICIIKVIYTLLNIVNISIILFQQWVVFWDRDELSSLIKFKYMVILSNKIVKCILIKMFSNFNIILNDIFFMNFINKYLNDTNIHVFFFFGLLTKFKIWKKRNLNQESFW